MITLPCRKCPSHPRRIPPVYSDWRRALEDAITDPAELCELLELPPSLVVSPHSEGDVTPLLVPRTYLSRIERGNPRDPLLLQVLPQKEELEKHPGFSKDPLGEAAARRGPGLLGKYRSRFLIVATGRCAVHCRFCFRRHSPCGKGPQGQSEWEETLRRIDSDPSVREVILSGGDPLCLDDGFLAELARRLAAMDHLRRLRIHTRLPIMIPQRVTEGLIAWLRGTRLVTIVAVHVNHPAEIDDAVAATLGRLVEAGIPVLSQSVLLRGVNDQVDVLTELFDRLVDLRVMPYYLHQLDRVAGSAHFEVPEQRGIELVRQVRTRLPGYATPRYVRETPRSPHKLVLA
jgi:EF-P beta-lysylation protein EpmB